MLDGDKNIAFPGSAAFGWLSNESDFSRFSSRGGKSLDFSYGRSPDVIGTGIVFITIYEIFLNESYSKIKSPIFMACFVCSNLHIIF